MTLDAWSDIKADATSTTNYVSGDATDHYQSL